MSQILAAFISIPYGLAILMRGSDGLNRGHYSSGQAGLRAGIGGALILTSLAMLFGFRAAGVLTAIAILAGAAVALREGFQRTGRVDRAALIGRGAIASFLIALIVAGM